MSRHPSTLETGGHLRMGMLCKSPPFPCPSQGSPDGLRPPVAAELLAWEHALSPRLTAPVLDSMVHLVPRGVSLAPLRLSRAEASEGFPSQLGRAEGQEE
eukprot:4080509-Pyramimonas_sp.AAC.1